MTDPADTNCCELILAWYLDEFLIGNYTNI